MVRSADDRLLATVIGGDRYVVTVSIEAAKKEDEQIHSKCTCPVGHDGCKHAVAVVAEYLDQIGRQKEIPIADAEDPRWGKLENDDAEWDFDEDEIGEEVEGEVRPARPKSGQRTRESWDEKIKQHIHAKSREDLAELVWSLTQRFGEIREEFRERIALGEGDVDRLIAQARKELQSVTSQAAWRDHWNGEGNLPDYSKLLHRLERLVELGHADSVVRLGSEIIERGMAQVGQSHDEGETAMELAGCLAVVFKAVAKSNLPPAQKLLFAISACLQDDYGVIDDSVAAVLDAKYQPVDWSEVADDLARRLNAGKTSRRKSDNDGDEPDDDFSRNYQRDQISGWLIRALNNAGRGDEMLAVYEKEARTTGSYERLVKFLIEQKQYDGAQRWAREGIEKTVNKLEGIASNLSEQLCEVARIHKQWDIVAAHAAQLFFNRPSKVGFEQLIAAANKAGCQESVQRLAMVFLETGVQAMRLTTSKKGERKIQLAQGWPLPVPDYLAPLMRSEDQRRPLTGPHFDVLIDMAIADKRPDDVLRWYDTLCAQRKQSPYGSSWSGPSAYGDRVAEAVAKSHPQRAIDIYRQQVNQNLTQASVGAYETVAAYLRKMKPIMKSMERENDWTQIVEDIRLRHRNRPRFMEILDRLENRTILADQKTRR
ncbi:MAG: SWIM zinc finger family protein [Planctomycetota bacterium]|nr:SWIM zinc finger family protein [Planctomycetota bacterium]